EAALTGAYDRARQAAAADLASSGAISNPGLLGIPAARAVELQVEATVQQVTATHRLALARATDAYTAIIRGATIQHTTGVLTRREAAQRALTAFARAGIRGYTDRAGRTWDLVTYAETAT